MKRLVTRGVLVAVPLLLALTVPAAAGKTPMPVPRTLGTPVVWGWQWTGRESPITAKTPVNVSSNKIFVWNVLTGRRTLMSGRGTSRAAVGSTPIWGLAIAGGALPGSPPAPATANATRRSSPHRCPRRRSGSSRRQCVGPKIVRPASAQRELGFTALSAREACLRLAAGRQGPTVRRWKVGSTWSPLRTSTHRRGFERDRRRGFGRKSYRRPAPVRPVQGLLHLQAVRGRDLLTSGRLLKRFKPVGIDLNGGIQMAEVALQGDDLAVLTPQPRLKLYNWRSGALLHSYRVPRGSHQLDVQGQVATYIGARALSLHVLGLRSGKDAVFPSKVSPLGLIDVAIEAPGLAYGFNLGNGRGELDFVPMSRVLAVIAKAK